MHCFASHHHYRFSPLSSGDGDGFDDREARSPMDWVEGSMLHTHRDRTQRELVRSASFARAKALWWAVFVVAVVALFKVSAGHRRAASAAASLASGRSALWSEGSAWAFNRTVANRLWHIERDLVDEQLCPAVDEGIAALRRQEWPRPDAGRAPEISMILYINLDWDTARRRYMEEQLQELRQRWNASGHDLAWERVPGVGPDEVRLGDRYASWRAKGFSPATRPDVRGDWATAGCALGHYAAISRIPDGPNAELTLITEDDVEIMPRFLQYWKDLWPYVPKDWDVLRVGWFGDHQNCTQVVNARVDRAGWQDPMGGQCAYCGAQAYIVNPRRKRQVLERFERSKVTHADELLGAPTPQLEDTHQVPPLQAFVVWPTLATVHLDDKGHAAFPSDRVGDRVAHSASDSAEILGGGGGELASADEGGGTHQASDAAMMSMSGGVEAIHDFPGGAAMHAASFPANMGMSSGMDGSDDLSGRTSKAPAHAPSPAEPGDDVERLARELEALITRGVTGEELDTAVEEFSRSVAAEVGSAALATELAVERQLQPQVAAAERRAWEAQEEARVAQREADFVESKLRREKRAEDDFFLIPRPDEEPELPPALAAASV